MSDLLQKVLKLLMPRLLGSAIGSFPLPEFDLSALAAMGFYLRARFGGSRTQNSKMMPKCVTFMLRGVCNKGRARVIKVDTTYY